MTLFRFKRLCINLLLCARHIMHDSNRGQLHLQPTGKREHLGEIIPVQESQTNSSYDLD